mmetsp:Transcript_39664/g.105641  ORF Transcript_39664/g.105641 Transcript_39664/m.105641 type:complete len:211 (-) Transcript_39664:886-1518(-)
MLIAHGTIQVQQADLEQFRQASGEVLVVDVVLGESKQQWIKRVDELFGELSLLDVFGLLLLLHCVAGREEVIQEHCNADLEKDPLHQNHVRNEEEGRPEAHASVLSNQRELIKPPVHCSDGDAKHGRECLREGIEVLWGIVVEKGRADGRVYCGHDEDDEERVGHGHDGVLKGGQNLGHRSHLAEDSQHPCCSDQQDDPRWQTQGSKADE